jgi:hypothetical protein
MIVSSAFDAASYPRCLLKAKSGQKWSFDDSAASGWLSAIAAIRYRRELSLTNVRSLKLSIEFAIPTTLI